MTFWRLRHRPRPAGDPPVPAAPEAFPKVPDLVDWPRIPSRHPNWWQVARIEHHGLERQYVLIAETRTEDEAFRIAAQQASQVRITKWGSHARPYESFRPPRVVVEGTVSSRE